MVLFVVTVQTNLSAQMAKSTLKSNNKLLKHPAKKQNTYNKPYFKNERINEMDDPFYKRGKEGGGYYDLITFN